MLVQCCLSIQGVIDPVSEPHNNKVSSSALKIHKFQYPKIETQPPASNPRFRVTALLEPPNNGGCGYWTPHRHCDLDIDSLML